MSPEELPLESVMREQVELAESVTLKKEIQELAKKASVLTQQLQSDRLSSEEAEIIATELKKLVDQGYTAPKRRVAIYAKYQS